VQAAEDLGVAAIVCPTQSGTTARRVAAFRPSVPIAGIANSPEVLGRLTLVWGVRPLHAVHTHDPDLVLGEAIKACRGVELLRKNDLVAFVSGSPGKRAGATDTVRVVRV
jgi:pyruvate kinase